MKPSSQAEQQECVSCSSHTHTSGSSLSCTNDQCFLLRDKREISWQEPTEVKQRLCWAAISICWVNLTFSSFISFFGPLSNFTSAEKDSAAFLHTSRKIREQFSLGPLFSAPAMIGRDGNVISALTDVFTAFYRRWQMIRPLSHDRNPPSQPKAPPVSVQAAL